MVDGTSSQYVAYGGIKFWIGAVCEFCKYLITLLVKAKSDYLPLMVQKVKELEAKGVCKVKYIRCDNAPENFTLRDLCYNEHLGITFEFTGPGNPQYAGIIEALFRDAWVKIRECLNGAKLTTTLQQALVGEAALYFTAIHNMTVKDGQ